MIVNESQEMSNKGIGDRTCYHTTYSAMLVLYPNSSVGPFCLDSQFLIASWSPLP